MSKQKITLNKEYGLDLKKKYDKVNREILNLETKINKRFDLIIDKYVEYLSENHSKYLRLSSVHDVTIERKIEIIIQTESNYIKATSKQIELF